MFKDLEIELIENIGKKKKSTDSETTISSLKKKIISDLEDMVTLKLSEEQRHENKTIKSVHLLKETDRFIDIRNAFVSLYKAYIEINKYLIKKSKVDNSIKEMLNSIIENVVNRVESGKNKYVEINKLSKIKEIEIIGDILKKESKNAMEISMI